MSFATATAILVLMLNLANDALSELSRPRGVSISKASLYKHDQSFTCLDGSMKIPYSRVNDDYCDCPDASDEPGTSACPNGSFFCTNAGFRGKTIPSSWVNDGLCDCCDGSDEYDFKAACDNHCKELGAKIREEEERERNIIIEGNKIYQTYIEEAKAALQEKTKRREELKGSETAFKAKRDELRAIVEEVEIPEKDAKDEHKRLWEEEQDRKKKEADEHNSEEVFKQLDVDNDKKISIGEIVPHLEFDIDTNGEVSSEEAKEFLEDNDEVDYEVFFEKVWPNIKEIYKGPKKTEETGQAEEVTAPPSPVGDEGFDDSKYDDEYYDEDDDDEEDDYPSEVNVEDEQKDEMPDYNEETKKLIAAADQARADFREIDEQYKDIEKEMKQIEGILNADLGENYEFYPLRDQCFEFTDSQYRYKLCPFSTATQRGKHGGSETTLGNWGHWSQKYSEMKYDRGQNCWNGPDRSVKVSLQCGVENELTSASEPNRCEYHFTFKTPAACAIVPPPASEHDEL